MTTKLIRTIIFVLVAILAGTAFAAVPTVEEYKGGRPAGDVWYSSPEAACAAYVADVNGDNTTDAMYQLAGVAKDGSYWWCGFKTGRKSRPQEGFPGTWYDPLVVRGGACPQNSTKNAQGTCDCDAGTKEEAGQCKPPEACSALANHCASMAGQPRPFRVWNVDGEFSCYDPPDDFFWDQPKFPSCDRGCTQNVPGTYVGVPVEGGTVYAGIGTLTGSVCGFSDQGKPDVPGADDHPKAEPADGRCAGQKGNVNGKDVCIPYPSATGDGITGKTTNPDGSSSENKSSTTCTNGVCTTTNETTTKDSQGNVTGTSTSSTSTSVNDYCSKNPASQVCAAVTGSPIPQPGKGTGSGNSNSQSGCQSDDCTDSTGPGGPSGGSFPGTGGGPEIGSLWEKKYPDGPIGVWNEKSEEIKASGLAGLAGQLMPEIQPGGAPPTMELDFNFGRAGNFGGGSIAPDPGVWLAIRALVILCALILARRLIFGG